MPTHRLEADSLGELAVPAAAYYGVQTLRAAGNFRISGIELSQFPTFLRSLAMVKKAAALTNHGLGLLPADKCRAITRACDEVIGGRFHDMFPLDVFQGGAGTSTNMNMNEVIANRALEHLGLERGNYAALHPNDDVNLSQSTNDTYPTAIRMAVMFGNAGLVGALTDLARAFERKSLEFKDIVKLGRTQLQDAVPMTLGQEFGAFAVAVREDAEKLIQVATNFREINLGGTAIGTGINTDPFYGERVVDELSRISGLDLVPATDLIEASWDMGAFVLYSGMLKRTAVKLSKIANDIRLLSSGPRGGLAEIQLPARQPGSSIMPGKVNPVIPEVVNQVCFQVIGNDLVVTLAAEAGQLQLNVMEPVIAFNLFQSIDLLTNAVVTFRENCIAGIRANLETCRRHLDASVGTVTALVPLIGYERATKLATAAIVTGKPIRVVAQEWGIFPESVLEKAFDPQTLTRLISRPVSSPWQTD